MKEFSKAELELIEWLKTFKNRYELIKYSEKVYKGLLYNNHHYLLEVALPINNTAHTNKERLIELAKSGKAKPQSSTKLYRLLKSYTRKGSECYDLSFYEYIKKLRPDWFNQKQRSFLKMLNKMPADVKFIEDQVWAGVDKKYTFFSAKYGEFVSNPTDLMSKRGSWIKGLSGHPREAREKTSESRKRKIKCLENKKTYSSIKEASRITALHQTSILRSLKEKRSTGGYTFVYVEEEND